MEAISFYVSKELWSFAICLSICKERQAISMYIWTFGRVSLCLQVKI